MNSTKSVHDKVYQQMMSWRGALMSTSLFIKCEMHSTVVVYIMAEIERDGRCQKFLTGVMETLLIRDVKQWRRWSALLYGGSGGDGAGDGGKQQQDDGG